VHVVSWQGAYRGLLPDALLDALDVARRRAGWTRVLAAADERRFTLVAEEGGVVGLADVVPSRDPGADERTAEVTSIYALPEAWGTGAGRELMAAATAAARDAGYRAVTLWVLDTNERARRFYDRAGFRPDGAEKTDVLGGAAVTEVRYRREL
jgi:GNAT superfamily N-acetyltransferase